MKQRHSNREEGNKMVENCYRCLYYKTCFLRISLEELLTIAHHKIKILKNSVPLPLYEVVAEKCKAAFPKIENIKE